MRLEKHRQDQMTPTERIAMQPKSRTALRAACRRPATGPAESRLPAAKRAVLQGVPRAVPQTVPRAVPQTAVRAAMQGFPPPWNRRKNHPKSVLVRHQAAPERRPTDCRSSYRTSTPERSSNRIAYRTWLLPCFSFLSEIDYREPAR